jgi:hypothetical protein
MKLPHERVLNVSRFLTRRHRGLSRQDEDCRPFTYLYLSELKTVPHLHKIGIVQRREPQ